MTELLPIALILIAAALAFYWKGYQSGKEDGYLEAERIIRQRIPSLLIRAKQEGVQAQRRAQEVTDGVVTAIIEAETKL